MPRITVQSGADLHVVREGSGPPLLLIMGTGLDHSVWDLQVEAYRERFECILFDNHGTGRSSKGPGRLSVRSMAADVALLLDALAVDQVHVSGLSLGSCIAQELALLRPEAVKSLQLHGTWARADGYAGRKFRSQLRLLQTFDLKSFQEINILWSITPETMRRHPRRVEDQVDRLAASSSREALIDQYRADLEHDALARLPQIQAPTLVTVGSFDTALPPVYGEEVAAAIPNSQLVVFERGGHLHNLEQPEEFNRVTLEFLLRQV